MGLIRNLKAPVLNVDSDIDEMIRPNRYLLTVMGVWPFQPNRRLLLRIFALLRIAIILIALVHMIIFQFITMCSRWNDINALCEVVSMMLGSTVVTAKFLYLLYWQSDYRAILIWMREFWCVAKNQHERFKIVEIANHARLSSLLYSYVLIFELLFITSAPLLINLYNYMVNVNGTNYERILPADLFYGSINTQLSPNYEIIFIQQTLGHFCGVVCTAGLDSIMMTMIMHFASQFKFISVRLQAIGQEIFIHGQLTQTNATRFRNEIVECFVHHQKILSVFKEINYLFGPVIFGQLLLAAVGIGVTGLAIMQTDTSMENVVKFSIFLLILWLQMWFWCWSGEIITRESLNIGHVIFRDMFWPTLPTIMQKDLALVILRSQKQCQVTAIGLQVMNMQKLTEVFNSAMSYLAMLRSLRNK